MTGGPSQLQGELAEAVTREQVDDARKALKSTGEPAEAVTRQQVDDARKALTSTLSLSPQAQQAPGRTQDEPLTMGGLSFEEAGPASPLATAPLATQPPLARGPHSASASAPAPAFAQQPAVRPQQSGLISQPAPAPAPAGPTQPAATRRPRPAQAPEPELPRGARSNQDQHTAPRAPPPSRPRPAAAAPGQMRQRSGGSSAARPRSSDATNTPPMVMPGAGTDVSLPPEPSLAPAVTRASAPQELRRDNRSRLDGPSTPPPSSPVSQYLLERDPGGWSAQTCVLTLPCA